MNKSWITLIVMGVVFLIAAIAWDAYQTYSGARSNVDLTLIEYQRNTLFSSKVENHLSTDPMYLDSLTNTTDSTNTTNTTNTTTP